MAHNLALCAEVFECQILLFQLFCLLKLHFFGLFLHLFVQHFLHVACVALEYFFCQSNVFLIFFVALLAYARRFAVVYVILQTRLILALVNPFLRNHHVASARFIELFD